MQAADSEFHQLLRDIQQGREEAARKLVDRYGSALLRVIRRRLDPRLRQQFDSIDFLQEALATFLCQPPAPEAFNSAEALFSFLANLARNKVVSAQRHGNQAEPGSAGEPTPDGSTHVEPRTGPVGELTAACGRAKDAAAEPIRPENVLTLLHKGMTYREIAVALGIQVKQVQRVVERIRSRATP